MGYWEEGNMVKWEWCYLSTSCCPRVVVCPGESINTVVESFHSVIC